MAKNQKKVVEWPNGLLKMTFFNWSIKTNQGLFINYRRYNGHIWKQLSYFECFQTISRNVISRFLNSFKIRPSIIDRGLSVSGVKSYKCSLFQGLLNKLNFIFYSQHPRPCGLKHNLPILHFGFLMYDHQYFFFVVTCDLVNEIV